MAAGKEFHAKATHPHQMWATDASHFRVSGWGFYYLVTVMDDFPWFVLAWRLQTDMTVRVGTWSEPPLYGIDRLEWQSADLKDLVAELSLDLHRLKKTSAPSLDEGATNA